MVEEPDRTSGALSGLGQDFEGLAGDLAFQTAHDLRGSRAGCCAGEPPPAPNVTEPSGLTMPHHSSYVFLLWRTNLIGAGYGTSSTSCKGTTLRMQ
jgi:hypothetical protein